METTQEINLKDYRLKGSLSFYGTPQGQFVRKQLHLDEQDKGEGSIKIIIPSDTVSFNPSFFLGLFHGSAKSIGVKGFISKYRFEFETKNPDMKYALSKNIQDGIRSVSVFM